jgi:hypothetical protein
MSTKIKARILLDIECWDRKYHYSDKDGPAHKLASSNNGQIIVEADIVLYKGLITNSGDIKEAFDLKGNQQSISSVSVTIINEDRLDLNNDKVAIESANAKIYLIEGDMYDQTISQIIGKIDNVSYDESTLKFDIRSEEITVFKNVPEIIFDEKTFQTQLILQNANIESSDGIIMRFGALGGISGYDPADRIISHYVKRISHPALAGREDDFWRGARIDVVDANGALGDPKSESFAIGEFAVAIESTSDAITLPTVCDRYFLYTFIENVLRQSNEETPAIGSITLVVPGSLTNLDYFILGDGNHQQYNFYFDKTGGGVPQGGIQINISGAVTATDVAIATKTAVDSSGLDITTTRTGAKLDFVNNNNGPAGNITIVENVTTSLVPVGMSGGGPTNPYNVYDIINNTMRNTSKAIAVQIKNGDFASDSEYWILGTGWSINVSDQAYCDGTQIAATALNYNGHVVNEVFVEGTQYEITFTLISISAGSFNIRLRDTNGPVISVGDPIGIYKQIVTCGAGLTNNTFDFIGDAAFIGIIDNIEVRCLGTPVFMIIRKPVPENADSIGKPFPIVYGHAEKMWAVWAISAKSTRQNSLSAGDDVYIIAGHKIKDKRPTDVKVYFGLDENAQGMNYKPGTIDFVPNPLPSGIGEIDHWNESGYSLRDPTDGNRNVCPFHKLVEITTNKGDIVTAIKLRGDEYTGWRTNNEGNEILDGDLPAVNGQPQFPIRYGLGNSKIYVSFRGYEDANGEITGVPGGLIEHPIDIMKHFIWNHTNAHKEDNKIDEQSFADSKSKLENWKFAVVINEIVDGKQILDRIAQQCKTIWRFSNGVFSLQTIDLENRTPTFILDQKKHFADEPEWSRPKISEMYNDFIFKYGFNAIKKSFDRVVVRNKSNDQLCRNMYSQYGIVRSMKVIECPDIYDSFTINKLADHYILLHAIQRRELKVNLRLMNDTKNLKPGVVTQIRFYDDEIGEYDAIYLVLAIGSRREAISLEAIELPLP